MQYYLEICGEQWLVFQQGETEAVYSDERLRAIESWLDSRQGQVEADVVDLVR